MITKIFSRSDLLPLEFDDQFISNLKKEIPELPDVKKKIY